MRIVGPNSETTTKAKAEYKWLRPMARRQLTLLALRVLAIIVLLVVQSRLKAYAENEKNIDPLEEIDLTKGDVVKGFDSHACGDLDYQSMWMGKSLPKKDPCRAISEARILVDTTSHLLTLCDSKKTQKVYDIAIGQGGVDKHREGDNRTPLGTYSITPARLSSRFGIFILVGYPTDEQIKQGYTGDSIGIHGPERPNQCKGLENVERDWTEGCMAVTNDVFIEEIAAYILKNPGIQVTIY